jgi:hypothetical protein
MSDTLLLLQRFNPADCDSAALIAKWLKSGLASCTAFTLYAD